MSKPYNGKLHTDKVNRTFVRYSSQIGEALTQLRSENPNYGIYKVSPGNVVEARFDGKSVTGISFSDVKKLEARVQELTGDPSAQLVRKVADFKKKCEKHEELGSKVTISTYDLDWLCSLWLLDEKRR